MDYSHRIRNNRNKIILDDYLEEEVVDLDTLLQTYKHMGEQKFSYQHLLHHHTLLKALEAENIERMLTFGNHYFRHRRETCQEFKKLRRKMDLTKIKQQIEILKVAIDVFLDEHNQRKDSEKLRLLPIKLSNEEKKNLNQNSKELLGEKLDFSNLHDDDFTEQEFSKFYFVYKKVYDRYAGEPIAFIGFESHFEDVIFHFGFCYKEEGGFGFSTFFTDGIHDEICINLRNLAQQNYQIWASENGKNLGNTQYMNVLTHVRESFQLKLTKIPSEAQRPQTYQTLFLQDISYMFTFSNRPKRKATLFSFKKLDKTIPRHPRIFLFQIEVWPLLYEIRNHNALRDSYWNQDGRWANAVHEVDEFFRLQEDEYSEEDDNDEQ